MKPVVATVEDDLRQSFMKGWGADSSTTVSARFMSEKAQKWSILAMLGGHVSSTGVGVQHFIGARVNAAIYQEILLYSSLTSFPLFLLPLFFQERMQEALKSISLSVMTPYNITFHSLN